MKNAININDADIFIRKITHTYLNEDKINWYEKSFENILKYYVNINTKGCITFIILITFSSGFPKKIKEVGPVREVGEETHIYMKPLGKFLMQNIRISMIKGFYCVETQLINAEEAF